jgi:pimeloyl-ACP methyl ester carboxylesterase
LTDRVATDRRVEAAGLSLAVSERGERSRATVVLVHGFPDTSAVWNPVAERLATDLHVVTYDVRGAGRSDVPPSRRGYALRLLVEDLAAVLDATSPDAPVHLVGHDWGSIQGWEAVTTKSLTERFASYTSVSGPPLDHAALWARRHLTLRRSDLTLAVRQALHSWYIAYFQLPVLPELVSRRRSALRLWAAALHGIERVPTDADWPAPTFGDDFAHGVELYRANVGRRMRHPQARHTDVPVQLIVPLRDRYVTPALLGGLEAWTSLMWRRPVGGGHWVIRTDPDMVAVSVREVVSFVETGTESEGLRACRASS